MWILYEASFAISMLEPWEKILIHTFAFGLLSLLYYAVSHYLPARLHLLGERVQFYLFGSENDYAAIK
ncbi:hypothetical protein MNV49_003343 [Pseudohyphozyma bogoriensis]|nr:hypothetical protein MNV49_003343 [Pseudohyphozyma bogoriensis]